MGRRKGSIPIRTTKTQQPYYSVEENGMVLAPERDEPMSHFEAKWRIRRLMEAIGYYVQFEYVLPRIYTELKGECPPYRVDLRCEHPVLETMNRYIELNGSSHDKDYKIKHRKDENRAKDIEKGLQIRLYDFDVEEIIGRRSQPDEWIYAELGVEPPR
jgi:hypothetical protein